MQPALLTWPTFVALLDPAALVAETARATDLPALPAPAQIDTDHELQCADIVEIRRVVRIVSRYRARLLS